MRFRKESVIKKGLASTLDLTPVVDIVFNLLIFFALSLNFAVTSGGINVKLPKASSAEPIRAEEITINLTSDGKIFLHDKQITLDKLSERLKEKQDKESLIIIRADKSVEHGRVVEAMDVVRTNGFSRLAIAVTSYLIEGGGSRNYENTKALIHRDSSTWHELMDRLTDATISYLNNQITAGADVVQIFDSWVGCLSPDDYKDHVLPFMKKLITNVNKNTPIIHFGTDTASLLELMKEAGGNVIGLDWRVDLKEAWTRIGHDRGVQGNLDPAILFTNPAVIRRHVKAILDKAQRRAGHIFNLGHGVLPATPVDNVLALIDFVHEFSSNS